MRNIIETYMMKNGFSTWQPKVALFDMDGVLYDSMPNHSRSWEAAMKLYHINISKQDAYLYEGMRGVEVIKKLFRDQRGEIIDDERAEEMYRTKSQYYAGCDIAPVIPHVKDVQQTMKNFGMKIGVVTGSGQATLLDRILQDFQGLVDEDVIVTANNVTRGKPHPEPYIVGMDMAGSRPWETIVVENAPLGVRASNAARCFTIAVNTGPLHDRTLKREGADLIVHSMRDLNLLLPLLLTPTEG